MLTINNTVEGYLKDVEIKGNTWQDSENLADIRSVGTKVEGQELYEIPVLSYGKNLSTELIVGRYLDGGEYSKSEGWVCSKEKIKVSGGKSYVFSCDTYNKFYYIFEYNSNMELIRESATKNKFTTNINTVYINFSSAYDLNLSLNSNIQLEEGTQATSFEPYKEHKLTILSPTPLEKVGDVADRIVCKDGVWGIEKNIHTHILNGSNLKQYFTKSENTFFAHFSLNKPALLSKEQGAVLSTISNKYAYNTKDEEHCYIEPNLFAVYMSNNKYPQITSTYSLTEYFNLNPTYIKYVTQPQFIPLPHDQQVKLRTFADRTNVSFDTEIEPTLKAQVPKSLGATVNSHTTQIDNLNKELDRVKKLEESTVSTVTTNKAFTSINETSGGYFEDVKIEGKTLVNLKNNGKYTIQEHGANSNLVVTTDTNYLKATTNGEYYNINGWIYAHLGKLNLEMLKPNTKYTIIGDTIKGVDALGIMEGNMQNPLTNMVKPINNMAVLTTNDLSCLSRLQILYAEVKRNVNESKVLDIEVKNLLILEGDHTDKDISYFEGLKSVGQDTDEISVLSQDGMGNLFDGELNNVSIETDLNSSINAYGSVHIVPDDGNYHSHINPITIKPNTTYIVGINNSDIQALCFMYDKNMKPIKFEYGLGSKEFTTTSDTRYARVRYRVKLTDAYNYSYYLVQKSSTSKDYIEDKKQILYYNPNTQTWEKPVLREWDSIEKHSDGKYYYHKRSGEVMLDGSEIGWECKNTTETNNTFMLNNNTVSDAYYNSLCICDKFTQDMTSGLIKKDNCIRITEYSGVQRVFLVPTIDKCDSTTTFKQWLQANPTTVVYQLAKEEVYECINLDLITYPDETNLIVSSGAIQPKLELKVLSNVSNVVKLLQEKVSILENNTSSYIVTQNRLQLASTYAADSVTFKVDYASAFDNRSVDGYNPDLYNLILSNILVGKDNYDYDKMFSIILDYASWDQISWEQFDELVLLMDIQRNPPIEIPEEDYTEEEIPEI